MTKYLFTFPFILICTMTFGQEEKGRINLKTGAGGFVEELPLKKEKIKGDYYLNTTWYEGDVTVNGVAIVKNKPIKIDIQNNTVEVKFENNIRFMYLTVIDTITWFDTSKVEKVLFINSRNYGLVKPPIFEVVYHNGNTQLFEHTSTRIIKANYNPALDIGDKSDKIIKEQVLYYSFDGKSIKELPKAKKAFLSIFDNNAQKVKAYIKSNNLSFKEVNDIINILAFSNSL